MMIIVILFLLIGIYMLTGRGGFLIAGYNMLPKEQKQKYDEKRLCRFTGVMIILATLYCALMEFTNMNEIYASIGFVVITLTFVIVVNVSSYFKAK
ncbi:hypothetical protein CW676_10450 [Macrococcoides caseolyticum]|uniref:DUF3784 domain-containing protein n=1 Tax=Macrococcoides caseolyticum TaxID=69966 RepID=UPI000C3222A6|nr:DUF3784 domain-containing protein [Macrococcus caseolyticus]PKE05979.1 hypothetical protein CW692_10780 [Macrococcus caseolyticus]PKE23187.1 hypothetical protein CW689_10430 [Macrococcus caseolyticus]PKE52276.1 hypothetical protein CW676_10450 [Macrococcus caseolyticus]PKF37781.1 hypothetical protein CW681_10300 [Macrococcus caseolyticus]